MSTPAKTPGDVLMLAAVDCEHSIDVRTITLRADATGGTALNQLKRRLEAGLPLAVAMMQAPVRPQRSASGAREAFDTILAEEPATLNAALALARADAAKIRENARLGGHYDDQGAAALERLCSAFECGLRGTAPEFMREFVTEAKRNADPEFIEYQRLHQKFGGNA